MSALFGRVVRVIVAPRTDDGLPPAFRGKGFDVSNLDCVFHAKKSLKLEPNTCELRVFNMAESTRSILSSQKRLLLSLEAGYPDRLCQIFFGEVRGAVSSREGPDIITDMSTGDSEKEIAASKLHVNIGPDTSAEAILRTLAQEMGVGLGNIGVAAEKIRVYGTGFFPDGAVLTGNISAHLERFCDAVGLECSVQNGVLQFLEKGKALQTQGVLLSPETGLIGSPTIDHKGVVSATALIQPGLDPGRIVKIDSFAFKGDHRITNVEYTGDTSGQDWYAKIHAKPIS